MVLCHNVGKYTLECIRSGHPAGVESYYNSPLLYLPHSILVHKSSLLVGTRLTSVEDLKP